MNYVKFAESAPMASNLEANPVQTTDKESYALFTHIAHVLLHVFHMYAHILHHCRLVLCTPNFTIETIFYIKCMCILPIALIDPNNIPKAKLTML